MIFKLKAKFSFKIYVSTIIMFTCLHNIGAYSQEKNEAFTIMQQLEKANSPSDEVVKFNMNLIDSKGGISSRTATFYKKQKQENSPEENKLIRFHTPAEMKDSAVLTVENANRSDDQWLYLPVYHTSRKIPSSNRSDRYMGTDFFYEDVSDDKLNEYNYKIIGKESIAGRNYTMIEQVPIDENLKKESSYTKKVLWVDSERNLATKVEYYDKSGKLFKRFTAENSVQVNNYWRWQKSTMLDLQLNHKTTIDYQDRKINTNVDKTLFSLRNLERP